MKTSIYEHRSGLKVVPDDVIKSLSQMIESIEAELSKNTVTIINKAIKNKLAQEGWTGEYRLDPVSKITITSYFSGIGLCLQTGNISRIYADLLKLQTLYVKGKISSGIIIIPEQNAAKELGSNMANADRLIRELPIFNQVITMPMVIIAFDKMEES